MVEGTQPSMRSKDPMNLPTQFIDVEDLKQRVKAAKVGYRALTGHEPSAASFSRLVLSPIETQKLPKMFSFSPKWTQYDVQATKEENETAHYAFWANSTASDLYENINNLTDGKWLKEKILGFPKTEKAAKFGKFMTDASYRASIWDDKKARDAVDKVASVATILKALGIGPKELKLVPDKTVHELMGKVTPLAKKVVTRTAATNLKEWWQLTGATPSDEWRESTKKKLKAEGVSDEDMNRKLVEAQYSPKYMEENTLLNVGGASAGLTGKFGKKAAQEGVEEILSDPHVAKVADDILDAVNKAAVAPPELPKYAGSINLERINTIDDVKTLILETSEKFKGRIDEARRGIQANEQTKKLADELGLNAKDIAKIAKGEAWNAEHIQAAREINSVSAKNTWELAKKARETGSNEDLAAFIAQLDRHSVIQEKVSGLATEAGRALQAHKIPVTGEYAGEEALKNILKAAGIKEKGVTEDIARRLTQVDPTNIDQINRFIRDVKKVKTSDKIFEVWVNSILSGPVTHIVNATSNTLVAITKPVERVAAATIDVMAYPIKGSRSRYYGEAVADIVGMTKSVTDGLRAGLRAFVTETPTFDAGKIETTVGKAIKGRIGRAVRTPGRLLMAEDDFFKTINQTGDLYAQAYRTAAHEGLRGKARANRIAELINNPTKEMGEHAVEEALYRTFTKELGGAGKSYQAVRAKFPGLRYVTPFVRTPINIAKYGIERTPIEFLNMVRRGDLKGLPPEAIDKLARATVGSLVSAGTYLYAKQGLVTGGGPRDKAKRDALYRQGWQPYSVKIGDTYYSYQRLEPLGMVLGLTADYAEITENMEDKDVYAWAGAIALAVSRNITNKTFMKGLSDVLDAAADPERYGENWIESLGGGFAPNFLNWVGRIHDPTLRDPKGPVEAVKTRIPLLNKTVKPKRNAWGETIKTEGGPWYRSLSPSKRTKAKDDPVEKELKELDITVHDPGRKISGVELDDELYDRYKFVSGQLAKQRLDKLVASDNYKSASVVEKQSMLQQTIEGARQEVGYAVILPKLDGGESILAIHKMVQEVKGKTKIAGDDAVAMREWYLGEIGATLEEEIVPNASAESKEGWETFNETWTMLNQTIQESGYSWSSPKMKEVQNWFKEEVRLTKEENPEFAKEFERYPFSVWVKY